MIEGKEEVADVDEVRILTTMIPTTTTREEKALQEVVGEDI